MRQLYIEIDEQLYDHLIALLQQLPKEKIHVVERREALMPLQAESFEQTVDYLLDKNRELYQRLA